MMYLVEDGKDHRFYIGQRFPKHLLNEIVEIQVDGDELEALCNRFPYLREKFRDQKSVRFFGNYVKHIIANW